MKALLFIASLLTVQGKTVFEQALSFSQSDVQGMMQNIRREADGKTWLLVYGDSITDGFGASDMLKTGYVNLLKEGMKLVDPTFDLVQNSAGFRCVSKSCFRPCERDPYCQEAHKHNVSAVTMYIGTNDCKGDNWNLENFKRDYVELCKSFRDMPSKPDVFVIIPSPVYKDGFGKVNMTLTNYVMPQLIRPLAKECGLSEDQVIDLHTAMGGSELLRPDLYCTAQHCDGYHPVDAGQNQMATTILESIMNYYLKNPKGRLAPPKVTEVKKNATFFQLSQVNQTANETEQKNQTRNIIVETNKTSVIEANKSLEANKTSVSEANKTVESNKTVNVSIVPEKAQVMSQINKTVETNKTVDTNKTVEVKKTAEVKKPVEANKTVEVKKQAEANKTEEVKKPMQANKTEESAKVAEVKQTIESTKTKEAPKTSDSVKKTIIEAPKEKEQPKPEKYQSLEEKLAKLQESIKAIELTKKELPKKEEEAPKKVEAPKHDILPYKSAFSFQEVKPEPYKSVLSFQEAKPEPYKSFMQSYTPISSRLRQTHKYSLVQDPDFADNIDFY